MAEQGFECSSSQFWSDSLTSMPHWLSLLGMFSWHTESRFCSTSNVNIKHTLATTLNKFYNRSLLLSHINSINNIHTKYKEHVREVQRCFHCCVITLLGLFLTQFKSMISLISLCLCNFKMHKQKKSSPPTVISPNTNKIIFFQILNLF